MILKSFLHKHTLMTATSIISKRIQEYWSKLDIFQFQTKQVLMFGSSVNIWHYISSQIKADSRFWNRSENGGDFLVIHYSFLLPKKTNGEIILEAMLKKTKPISEDSVMGWREGCFVVLKSKVQKVKFSMKKIPHFLGGGVLKYTQIWWAFGGKFMIFDQIIFPSVESFASQIDYSKGNREHLNNA